MKYVGGKITIAKDLAPIILETNPAIVIEPFCGALNVTIELVKRNSRVRVIASDADDDLMNMWVAVKDGWVPPTDMSREEYHELKSGPSSPLRTFAGYGCSFSGKWFGGYQESRGRNYCLESHKLIIKKLPYLKNITLRYGSYQDQSIPDNSVIYCDPPYVNTLAPGKRNEFDHEAFWQWIKNQKVPTYVSEYVAPDEMGVRWSREVKTDMNTKKGKGTRTEKLFVNQFCDELNHGVAKGFCFSN